SGSAYDDDSARERYSSGTTLPRRKAVSPLALVIIGVVSLLLLGFLANTFVQRLRGGSGDDAPPPSSASQTMLGPPPPVDWNTDDQQQNHSTSNNHQQPPPAQPPVERTVAQRAADYVKGAVSGGASRSILTVPQGWDSPAMSVAAANPIAPPTAADRAAAATGQRPTPPKIDSSVATAVGDLTETIRPGSKVYCTTQDAIDTSTGEGSFTCDTDRPVFAWDGVTPLIP